MIDNVNQYVNFLIKYNITQEQFLLCYLLYTDSVGELPDGRRKYLAKDSKGRPIIKMYEYINHIKKVKGKQPWTSEDVKHLEKVGFIKAPANNKLSPDMLILTDKFINNIFSSDDDFEKFWDEYPSFIPNFNNPQAGRKVKLKAVDPDELKKRFKKIIDTKNKFNFMMKNLQWAKKSDNVTMNIKNYLVSRQWREDNKLRQEDNTSFKSEQIE